MSSEPDEELTEVLGSFMTSLREYLDEGGPDDVIDRILAAATVAAAAVLILWSPHRKVAGLAGLIASLANELWSRRHWLGIPNTPEG